MPEERYLKIESCKSCPFTGRTSSRLSGMIIFVCANPINSSLDKPRALIGSSHYPITYITKDIHDNPIPDWCKLPSKVGD